ncbi:MAG TPA: hypothetical protein VGC42_21255 [Kofleriaceae bacterium]
MAAMGTACADDTNAATDEDYANGATSLSNTAAHQGDEVSAMRAAAALARGTVPDGLAPATDGGYLGSDAGLAYRYRLICHDARSAAATCTPSSTSADVTTTWSGGLELPSLAMSIAHDATWKLSGITPSLAHVDGTGHLTYDTRDDATSYHYRYDATYHVIVDDQRAIGGDIKFAITGEHADHDASTRRFAIAAQLTFNPDDTAELSLDDLHHYRVVMATGAVTPID